MLKPSPAPLDSAVKGCLVGTAVGDALGLPFEGLRQTRVLRMLGSGPLRHHFLLGRGMVSDDTEQTLMVVQSLIEAADDVGRFRSAFARRLRVWFLLVPAGIGLATIRACLRLLMGVPPTRSGVPSAGNGAAMRSAIIGAWYRNDPDCLRAFVEASTLVTHTDARAREGAIAVALAAAAAARGEEPNVAAELRDPAWTAHQPRGNGVSGYVVETVKVALECAKTHPTDYRAAVEMAIRRGGDTDTVAAIVGGIVGARVGVEGIPTEWRARMAEWPRTLDWMQRLGPYPMVMIPLRNLLFLAVVLTHGFRRLLPPY